MSKFGAHSLFHWIIRHSFNQCTYLRKIKTWPCQGGNPESSRTFVCSFDHPTPYTITILYLRVYRYLENEVLLLKMDVWYHVLYLSYTGFMAVIAVKTPWDMYSFFYFNAYSCIFLIIRQVRKHCVIVN